MLSPMRRPGRNAVCSDPIAADPIIQVTRSRLSTLEEIPYKRHAQNHFEHSTHSICEVRDQSIGAATSRGEI